MNEAGRVRLETIPTDQQVKNSHRKSQTSLEVSPITMGNLLEMANSSQHGKDRFDNHTLIVVKRFANLEIGRIALFGMEPKIGENNRTAFETLDQRMKSGVMDISLITISANHLAEMIEQEAQLTSDNPAAVGKSFPANLMLRTPFTDRVDQLDPIAIDHTQQTRFRQKVVGPILMGCKQTKQSGAFGQLGEQMLEIAYQPSVEGAVTYPLQGKQYTQGDYFTWIQVRLRMFGFISHIVMYATKQCNDKIFCSHEVSPFLIVW
jgi:hypothetical protein